MRILLVIPVLLAASSASVHAATPEDVAALRQEVDRLATELEDLRRQARDELGSLRAERAELERQVRLERVRAATLAELAREAEAEAAELDRDLETHLGPARTALAAARAYLDEALPFQLEARRAELDRVKADLEAGDASHAMTRLWRFVQQEDAMGGEVALSRQSIALAGETRLVDVARIGMAMLYYRAPDGTVAQASRSDDEWQIEPIESPAAAATVRELFRALEDNRRFGALDLVLPEGYADAR